MFYVHEYVPVSCSSLCMYVLFAAIVWFVEVRVLGFHLFFLMLLG